MFVNLCVGGRRRGWGRCMTSEVILMNQHTVVLAADSAVTFRDGRSSATSYLNGVQKIFTLDDQGPICAMIYGSGSYCGLQWRIVFEEFANTYRASCDTVETYAEKLVKFLANIKEEAGFEIDDARYYQNFDQYIERFTYQFCDLLVDRGWENAEDRQAAAEQALEALRESIRGGDDSGSSPQMRAICDTSPPFETFLKEHLDACMDINLGWFLEDDVKDLPETVVKDLKLLVTEAMCLNWFPTGEYSTGVVLAGFGKAQPIPGAISIEFSGGFAGFLPSSVSVLRATNSPVPSAVFQTFAQHDLLTALVDGVTPDFQMILRRKLLDAIIERHKSLVVAEDASRSRKLRAHKDQKLVMDVFLSIAQALDSTTTDHRVERLGTIRSDISQCPPDLLLEYAKKLMRINIQGMEVLHNSSVGKPIRVFAISKGRVVEELET